MIRHSAEYSKIDVFVYSESSFGLRLLYIWIIFGRIDHYLWLRNCIIGGIYNLQISLISQLERFVEWLSKCSLAAASMIRSDSKTAWFLISVEAGEGFVLVILFHKLSEVLFNLGLEAHWIFGRFHEVPYLVSRLVCTPIFWFYDNLLLDSLSYLRRLSFFSLLEHIAVITIVNSKWICQPSGYLQRRLLGIWLISFFYNLDNIGRTRRRHRRLVRSTLSTLLLPRSAI